MSETPSPHEITLLLQDWRQGDLAARKQLIDLVHRELYQMAARAFRHERVGHTLQATALVSELYLRLLAEKAPECRDRAHFFAIAANTMRRILVDHARAVHAERRGGRWARVSLTWVGAKREFAFDEVLSIHAALERLSEEDDRAAKVVEMRFFAGLESKQIAEALGVSEITVKRDWRFARAWLLAELGDSIGP